MSTASGTALLFWDEERGREERYDFSRLGLPPKIARSFATAFKTLTGGYRASSRQQAWLHLRRFARYLSEGADASLRRLSDPNVLLGYKEALLRQMRLQKTAGSRYNFARQLLRWLVENEQDGPWRSAILFGGVSTLVRETHNVRDNEVSPRLLHRIASACKVEIDQIIERFGMRERVLRGEEVSSAQLDGIRPDLLKQVLELEARRIYRERDFNRIGRGGLQRVGLRRAEPFRALTNRTALPYYILLIINTCGNPVGIMNLEIDCLQPHPTDTLKQRIYWGKNRSQREQAYDVLASGHYSASRCVSDLLRLTEPIRWLASTADARKLMLTRVGCRATRLNVQSVHNALAEFRSQHRFPYFTFADLRKSAATAIDEYAKSSRAVQKALQHKSRRTSWVYLQARRSIDRRYEGVLQYQGQMVALAQNPTAKPPPTDTFAGIGCRDPLAGVAPGSTKNHPCLQWLECCRCPNAIVIKDDPRVIARILRAAQSLREMQVQAATSAESTQHFESAFRPTLHVIESQILPKVARRVRIEAEAVAATLPALPIME
jgi:hypothetical protein